MKVRLTDLLWFYVAFSLFILIWGYWNISSHSPNSIVSWDEGFHGGSALFISESLRNNFNFLEHTYILNDFKNGIIWYLPLWVSLAGLLGAIFGPSLEIFRFSTFVFATLSLLLVASFVKKVSDFKSAAIATITLAFSPIFIVYSHLMMLEVPLLFSTSLSLIFFFRFLFKPKLTRFDYFITFVAFSLGVLTKITAIALIYAVVLTFGVILYLFFRESYIFKRFFSKHVIFFLLTSFITFTVYRLTTKFLLNADMLTFHLNQMSTMSGEESFSALNVFKILEKNLLFYTNDFLHMVPLAFFWIASSVSYFIVKRSLLSVFLSVWIIVDYIIFSSVKPQSVQYLLSIFAPISIATGLFWGDFFKNLEVKLKTLYFIFLILLIAMSGVLSLPSSETYHWRNLLTRQYDAVGFVVKNSKIGDRIISSGDGTRFLIRLLGSKKRLQTINGAATICKQSINDSTEWAIADFGPQNPIELSFTSEKNWKLVNVFPNSINDIKIFKNQSNTKSLVLGKGDIQERCARFLLLGENKFNFYPSQKNNTKKITVTLKPNVFKTTTIFNINPKEQEVFTFSQNRINQPLYFDIFPDLANIDKIEVTNLR